MIGYQYAPIDQETNLAAKRRVVSMMNEIVSGPLDKLAMNVMFAYHPEAELYVTHPLNELSGLESVQHDLWLPLRRALPDVERREDIVAGGLYRDGQWVACLGHYVGTFENDWLDIPATRQVAAVRFAEGHELRDGKIARSYLFIDFLDLMRQAGYWPVAPSLGREMRWLPPMTHDGVLLDAQDNAVSQATIERILRMHAALGDYNGQPPTRSVLDGMHMVDHWHPNFMWYGAAGIGSTRGLHGFEDHHQIPFLCAFPDRKGSSIGHFIRIGDGRYAVTGGWGYLQATHTGSGFLGMPPTGRRVAMRVMDFYRCDAETIVENWVPFDIPHLLLQMGVDVFGRMRHQFRQHLPSKAAEFLVNRG
jgi:predicted ester cyclase